MRQGAPGGLIAVALCGAFAPAAAAAQRLGGAPDFQFPVLRLALGLLLCTIVAIFAGIALKRFMHTGATRIGKFSDLIRPPARRIRVLETHRLSVHADICVISHAGRDYVIVVSPSGATIIREAEASAEPAP